MIDLTQEYDKYSAEDFEVWNLLFSRQIANIQEVACTDYLEGIKIVNFTSDRIPHFEETSRILKAASGWSLFVVPGIIPNKPFFELLATQRFCATTWLRKRSQLDYLEEPDMFHDVFGHVPLLVFPPIVDFLQELSKIALRYIDDAGIIEFISRIYWNTVEFGLIQYGNETKIYGAGILSSSGETTYCLGPIPERLPFDVDTIIKTPYIKEKYQEKYFVIDSYQQMRASIPEISRILENIYSKKVDYSMYL